MGFFDKMFKKGGIEIGAPMSGSCVDIAQVSDPAFSQEVLGKGIAIKPSDGKVYAPVDGTVSTTFPTKHAVGLISEDGVEILIHIGLDTVELKGEHFTVAVQESQKVKKGDLLVEADLDKIKEAGYDTITPVVICNTPEFKDVECITGQQVSPGDTVICVCK